MELSETQAFRVTLEGLRATISLCARGSGVAVVTAVKGRRAKFRTVLVQDRCTLQMQAVGAHVCRSTLESALGHPAETLWARVCGGTNAGKTGVGSALPTAEFPASGT